jgi:deoxyribonuclease IV
MLCSDAGDLGPYLAAVDWHPRAGLCLDTCHAFAAGHDLAARGGAARLLDALAPVMGRRQGRGGGRLRLIHANDSKDGCGSHRDRHANIGAGQIGTAPFAALLRHPATRACRSSSRPRAQRGRGSRRDDPESTAREGPSPAHPRRRNALGCSRA